MRRFETPQRQFGQIEILDVQFNPKSRDDVPALLMGLQHLYRTRREELRALLDRHILPDANRRVGRPGMDLWKVLVLGALKQGLGRDWDRLQELANEHQTLREMLGHGWLERARYERQNLIDNVSLMMPELLAEVNALLVASGHEVARKKPGAALAARVDSYMVRPLPASRKLEATVDQPRAYIRPLGGRTSPPGPRWVPHAPALSFVRPRSPRSTSGSRSVGPTCSAILSLLPRNRPGGHGPPGYGGKPHVMQASSR